MTKPRNGVFYTLDARTGQEALAPRGIGGTAYPSLKQVSLKELETTGLQDAGRAEESSASRLWRRLVPLVLQCRDGTGVHLGL